MRKNKRTLVWTLLCVSLFQMGMVALAPVIAEISSAFPGATDLAAQMAATFLNLVLVITALLSGPISRRIGRRRMSAVGMGLFAVAGAGGYLLTRGLWAVFLWSGLLGAGTGLFTPAVSSIMIDYLEEEERKTAAGWQTAAINLGGVILSFAAGMLAAKTWNSAYLVFLLSIPVIFMCLRFMPAERPAASGDRREPGKKRKIPAAVWMAALQTTVFAAIYFTFSTNISLLLGEKGYADTALAGTATAFFMLGGGGCGLLFRPVLALLKDKTAAGAFALLAVSYAAVYWMDGLIPLYAAAFVGGGSLSVIFPFFLVTIADKVDPGISVLSSSLILSVGPNLGSFISPLIITNLSRLTGDPSVSCRFLTAAVLAVLGAAALLAAGIAGKRRKRAPETTNLYGRPSS